VYYVEGNHVTIIDSDKVITAINGEPMEDHKMFKKFVTEDKTLEELECASQKTH